MNFYSTFRNTYSNLQTQEPFFKTVMIQYTKKYLFEINVLCPLMTDPLLHSMTAKHASKEGIRWNKLPD